MRLAYVVGEQLYVRELAALEGTPVPGVTISGGLFSPVFSPDGLSIAFMSLGADRADRAVQRVPITGGTTRTVCPVFTSQGMSWGRTGIVIATGQRIVRCAPTGGQPELLLQLDEVAQWPQLLPDGDTLLFMARPELSRDTDAERIVVHSLESGERRTLIEHGTRPRYLPSGHLLYAVDGTVFAAPFDPGRSRELVPAVPVLEGVREAVVSDTGALLYVPSPPTGADGLDLALADRSGDVTRLPIPPGSYAHPRASRSGDRLALAVDEGEAENVWVYQLEGGTALRRLTFGGQNGFPVVSADGERVAYQSDREGDLAIYWQLFDGTGPAERLTTPESGAVHVPESWSPDGEHLLFAEEKSARHSLWVLSIQDGQVSEFGGVQSANPPQAVFSPNGRWVAYASNPEVGGLPQPDRGVYLQPFPETGARYKAPGILLDFHPTWSPDGAALFYVPTRPRSLVSVSMTADPTVAFGDPVDLPPVFRNQPSLVRRDYDVLSDGRFIGLVPAGVDDASGFIVEMRIVLNWIEELKRLVPTS